MKIITISGLDGSGKSTQIELLRQYLESQGKKVFYFHAVAFGMANKLASIFKSALPRTEPGSGAGVVKASWLGVLLRKIFLRTDISRFQRMRATLEIGGYDYIISDRYFYDSVVNIAFLKPSFRKFLKLGFGIQKPDLAIYLQANPEKIMQRERKPDQGLEYLKKKKEIFDNVTEKWGLKIINGNRDKEIIFQEIKNLL